MAEAAEQVSRIIGGDPIMVRASLIDPTFAAMYRATGADKSIEVPCQQCGRGILLAPSGQRIALGDPESVVELDREALKENRIAAAGPSIQVAGGAAAICMWCAFADHPDLIARLNSSLANARLTLKGT